MPGVAGDREVFHLPVADLDTGQVGGSIELGGHGQPGGRGCGGYQVNDRLVAGQGPAAPVPGDLGEQAVFYLVPLAGTRWQVTDADFQAGLGGQRGQFGFPCAAAVAVGAATVCGDQQVPGVGIGALADGVPPGAQGVDGERGGLVIGPDADPAGVGPDVADAVRDRLAELPVHEVVYVDLLGITFRPPLPAAVLELPTNEVSRRAWRQLSWTRPGDSLPNRTGSFSEHPALQ